MSSLNEILKSLEEKLEDLQRDTKFCVNNYDYHHKNNEHEIVQTLQGILKESLNDGQQFLSYMKNVQSSIERARTKCCKIDEMLTDLGVSTENAEMDGLCATVGGSNSFHEEHDAGKYCIDVLDENKENED
ncbi:uncharacterized protein ACRADG_007670 isoform 1-T11 [Cochliomyia hominivorax]